MSRMIDRTGHRFERWMVISRAENNPRGGTMWLCRCDCGTEKVVFSGSLTSGVSKSCGCHNSELASARALKRNRESLVDLAGSRFGRLTVSSLAGETTKANRAKWNCVCDCGGSVVVSGNNLKVGDTQSCGCLQRERASASNSIDLTGMRFCRLIALERAEKDQRGKWKWACTCDCGAAVTVRIDSLASGDVKSCGCYQSDRMRQLQYDRAEYLANMKWLLEQIEAEEAE